MNLSELKSLFSEELEKIGKNFTQSKQTQYADFVIGMLKSGHIEKKSYFEHFHGLKEINWSFEHLDYFLSLDVDLNEHEIKVLPFKNNDEEFDAWMALREKYDNPSIIDKMLVRFEKYDQQEEMLKEITPQEVLYSKNIAIYDLLQSVEYNDYIEFSDAVFNKMQDLQFKPQSRGTFAQIASLIRISKEKSLESVSNKNIDDLLKLSQIRANPELIKNSITHGNVFEEFCKYFLNSYFDLSLGVSVSDDDYASFCSGWYIDKHLQNLILFKIKDMNVKPNKLSVYDLRKLECQLVDWFAHELDCVIYIPADSYQTEVGDYKFKSEIRLSYVEYIEKNLDTWANIFIEKQDELKYFLLSEEAKPIVQKIKSSGNQEFAEIINKFTPKQQRKFGVKL